MSKFSLFLRDVREDLKRYGPDGKAGFRKFVRYWLSNHGFFILFSWRYARFLRALGVRWWPRLILKRHHIEISLEARIEGGVLIGHGVGIVIGEGVVIKRGVTIYQNVTLGARKRTVTSANRSDLSTPAEGAWDEDPDAVRAGERSSAPRYPVIEEDAVIYAGAVVVGPVTVGKGARVAANALLMEDVPPGKTAIGNPARITGGTPEEKETGPDA